MGESYLDVNSLRASMSCFRVVTRIEEKCVGTRNVLAAASSASLGSEDQGAAT